MSISELASALRGEQGHRSGVTAAIEQFHHEMGQPQTEMIQHVFAMRDVLDSEQRRKFDEPRRFPWIREFASETSSRQPAPPPFLSAARAATAEASPARPTDDPERRRLPETSLFPGTLEVKPSPPMVDAARMRLRHRHCAFWVALAVVFLLGGCATKLSAPELDSRLDRVSRTAASRQAIRRVFPVHAQTKMEAWVLQAEAKSSPESSPLSLELADGFRLGRLRKIDCVVGGPFPELLDRLVLNGLLLNEDGALPGLRIILVSPAAPTPELRRAANARRVRLEYRALD